MIRAHSLLLLALCAAACGQVVLRPPLEENPVFPALDDGGYVPTKGSSGGGAGAGSGGAGAGTAGGSGWSGGGGGTVDAGPTLPQCDDSLKRCAADFSYPASNETSVELRGDFTPDGWTTGVPLAKMGTTWKASVPLPWGQDVQYKFVIDGTTWVLDPGNTATATSGGVTNSLRAASTCPMTYTCAAPDVPPGVFDWRDSVIYSIFVDRFNDADSSNNCNVAGVQPAANYYGGDWKGITAKIQAGYFTGLGVNTLLITDAVENYAGAGAGSDGHDYSAYHGYWPSDETQAEHCFGQEADLKAMVDAAHAAGLKVLLDWAMVHVHISSALYTEHPEWFWPLSFNGGNCVCDDNGVCPWATEYKRCWFTSYLPHWNYTDPNARAYAVARVIDWVQRAGFDGIRADAIKHVETTWMNDLRTALNTQVLAQQNPKQRFYMVGETYDFGNTAFIKSFVDPTTMLDGQFDFPLRRVLLQTTLRGAEPLSNLSSFMDGNDGYYGADAVMSTWIGNHDLGRIIHMAERPPRWDQYDNGSNCSWSGPSVVTDHAAYERVAVAYGVLFTNRGAPLLYYGDEIGMPGCGDPDNRRPMQWSGLTTDQQWLQTRISTLGQIRAAHPALRKGTRSTLNVGSDTWLYSMSGGGETLYVAVNRGDTDATFTGLPSQSMQELVAGTSVTGPSALVPARQVRVFK